MIISDGAGTGTTAAVSSDNRLNVSSRQYSRFSYMSRQRHTAFAWQNLTYNYTAADTILLVKNTDTRPMYVEKIIIGGDTATEVVIHTPVCATPTGTAVTGVNMDRTSSIAAVATAIANESTNAIGTYIERRYMPASSSVTIDYGGAIVIGQNQCIAVDYVSDGGAALVTIYGYYE